MSGRRTTSASAARKTKATAKSAKTMPAKRGGKRGGKKSTLASGRIQKKGKATKAIDDEAEEDTEEGTVMDEDEELELKTSESTSGFREGSVESEETQETREWVEVTPKICRSKKMDSSPVPEPQSPSPQKKRGKIESRIKTPAKRGKINISDNEDDDGNISPTKKTRTESPVFFADDDGNSEVEVLPSTPPRKQAKSGTQVSAKFSDGATANAKKASERPASGAPLMLPRRPAIRAAALKEALAKKAENDKVKSKAPDSGDQFFAGVNSDDDEQKLLAQTRLFRDNVVSHDEFQDFKEVLDEIEEGVSQDPNAVLDFEEEGAIDPILRHTYAGLPAVRVCIPDFGNYTLQTALLSEAILDQRTIYKIHRPSLLELVTGSLSEDDPFVINPARHDPSEVVAASFYGSNNKVVSFLPGPGVMTHRAVNILVGLTLQCNVVSPSPFQDKNKAEDRVVKQILVCPLRGEFERSIGFYGSVFKQDSFVINTFGITLTEGERINGLSIRTMPTQPKKEQASAPKTPLRGVGFTPSKNKGKSVAAGGLAGGLLAMRSKTAWGANDDIPIWDARQYFSTTRSAGKPFLHENVASLPQLTRDLVYGDVALVYHSVSNYALSPDRVVGTTAQGLSFNLYGIVLIASADL